MPVPDLPEWLDTPKARADRRFPDMEVLLSNGLPIWVSLAIDIEAKRRLAVEFSNLTEALEAEARAALGMEERP